MIVDTLRLLGEPMRWRIVELLADEELCVCHLVEELDAAQPLVSHHLRALRTAGLVTTRRDRQWTYYRLADGPLPEAAAALSGIASRARRRRIPVRAC
jgi:ArsR family transcriptional regulator, arsenate/arsenite/antimonite-responsive transcriptional repressor